MSVRRVLLSDGDLEVSGTGYAPQGGFARDGRAVNPRSRPDLLAFSRAALLCNDAALTMADGAWQLTGDPTEGALLCLALKAGLDDAYERASQPREDVLPFDAAHRLIATRHHDHHGQRTIMLKGAPEWILPLCYCEGRLQGPSPLDGKAWQSRMDCALAEPPTVADAPRCW